MTTRVIIAAAGPQKYWANHTGVPSHLVATPGKKDRVPLIVRTIEQIHPYVDEVYVTIPDTRDYEKYMRALMDIPVHIFTRMDRAYYNEYDSTKTLWNNNGRTILMLGDVIFSDNAIQALVTYDGEFKVFGRHGASDVTGTPYGEIFAVSWTYRKNVELVKAVAAVRHAYLTNHTKKCDGWRILRYMQGGNLNRHRVDPKYFHEINDYTDDFDKPEDYDRHPIFREMSHG